MMIATATPLAAERTPWQPIEVDTISLPALPGLPCPAWLPEELRARLAALETDSKALAERAKRYDNAKVAMARADAMNKPYEGTDVPSRTSRGEILDGYIALLGRREVLATEVCELATERAKTLGAELARARQDLAHAVVVACGCTASAAAAFVAKNSPQLQRMARAVREAQSAQSNADARKPPVVRAEAAIREKLLSMV